MRNDLLLHKAFVFACDSYSLCAPCLLLTEENGTLSRNSLGSKTIQFPAKQRPKTYCKAKKIISWRTEVRDGQPSGRTSYVPSFWDRGSGNQPSSEWNAGSRNRTAAVRGQRRDG